jgi:2-methylcitrate dehydratase PrpD
MIVKLIDGTDLADRQDLLQLSKVAFIDYLAALLGARQEEKVVRTAAFIGTRTGATPLIGQPYCSSPENAAFFNGFCSHYLDFDDAQANIAGHFSTVLFSTLLAVAIPQDTVLSFLTAYVAGAELEGILGSYVNPQHKQQGWHSTGTIGPIGAAAAIAKFKGLTGEATARLLSLGATQSAGMGFQAGTDTKPMHSGFAARNAVFSYFLLRDVGLTSSLNPFNNETGWLKTIHGTKLVAEDIEEQWLKPGQIIKPGLWMKQHPYCSAGINGAAGCQELYQQGCRLENCREVLLHFPPGADKALHYSMPSTGQEGRFSIEYVVWQILTFGEIRDELFKLDKVPEAFINSLPKIKRIHDLPPVEKSVRITKITASAWDGRTWSADVRDAIGSPVRPFTEKQLEGKLIQATSKVVAERLLQALEKWPQGRMDTIWQEL